MFVSLCICMSPIHLYGAIVENFKQLLLWSRWAKLAQNFIWVLDRSGEWKISEMVAAGWLRWPSCPYMVKKDIKNLLQYPGCHGAESLHKLSGMGESAKVAKMIVIRWCLTSVWQGHVWFPVHLYEPHTFVWENCWEFQMTSPLKPLSQFCSNFIWRLLRSRAIKDC